MIQKNKYLIGVIALLALALFTVPCLAMEGPDSIELDSLAELYEPVQFDHIMHVEAAGDDCSVCHHHTTGTPVQDENCIGCHANSGEADEVACSACHPANRFQADYLNKIDENYRLNHVDKVGLKAAYHIKCMGCHEENDAPTGCQDCHTRTEAGDKMFRSGKYAPKGGNKSRKSGH